MSLEVVRTLAAKIVIDVDKGSFGAATKGVDQVKSGFEGIDKAARKAEASANAAAKAAAKATRQASIDQARDLRERFAVGRQHRNAVEALERRHQAAGRLAAAAQLKGEKLRASAAKKAEADRLRIQHMSEKGGGVGDMLSGIGWTAAAIGGLMVAKRAFIDFNSTVEQSTISLAAQQMMFKKTDWQTSMGTATDLFAHYQEVARKSVGTTQDFIEMHKAIGASAYQAGATLEDLKQLTEGSVVASMSLGESSFTSAMDIKQALNQGVSVRDRFANLLLASQNITAKQFNALDKKKRVEVLKTAVTAPVFKEAAKSMEKSFAGVVSTLQDNLQIALGKIGKPLFQELTKEVDRLNQAMDKNPKVVEAAMKTLQMKLGEVIYAFRLIRDSIGAAANLLGDLGFKMDKASTGGKVLQAALKATFAPITTAWEVLQDIGYYLQGKASALGRALSNDKATYDQQVYQLGGRADWRGRWVPGATPDASGGPAFGIESLGVEVKERVRQMTAPVKTALDVGQGISAFNPALMLVDYLRGNSPVTRIGEGGGRTNNNHVNSTVNVTVNSSGPVDPDQIASVVRNEQITDWRAISSYQE